MLFRSEFSSPTSEQISRVGRIVTDWAILDNLVQVILGRLAGAPDYPSGALTESLTYDARIKALRNLAEIGRDQFRTLPSKIADGVLALAGELESNRTIRNRLAHWVIFRISDDEIACHRLATRLPKANRLDSAKYRNADLDAYIQRIREIAEHAEELIVALDGHCVPTRIGFNYGSVGTRRVQSQ